MDEDKLELEVLQLLKDNIKNAHVELFSDNAMEILQNDYNPGTGNATILVNLGDIIYDPPDARQCGIQLEIELAYYARLMRGNDGWREICNQCRQLITGAFLGSYPVERTRFGISETGHYIIGEKYIINGVYTFGE